MPAQPVGLDITSSALVAVMLKKRGKTYTLVRHAVAPLDHGIVSDGEVVDVLGLSAALRTFWDREGIKDKNVALGVANQRCIVRTIDLPRIKGAKQLREAISFEVTDNLPIPLENAVFDYHTVDTYKDDQTGVERQRHVVVMTYRESMERFRDAVLGAGLKLRRIDLAGFALMRAGLRSVADASDDEQIVALCDVGPTTTNLVVSRKGVCEFNRQVPFGTKMFSQTLSEQFGWGDDDAERVKLEAGILPLGGVESPGDPYTDSRSVMQFVADQFAAEIRTSFDYYLHATGGQHRVARVVIAGEGALMRGIEDRFAAELGVPVSILDASPLLDTASIEVLGANHAQYGTALGLAVEEAA